MKQDLKNALQLLIDNIEPGTTMSRYRIILDEVPMIVIVATDEAAILVDDIVQTIIKNRN